MNYGLRFFYVKMPALYYLKNYVARQSNNETEYVNGYTSTL